jgi:adenylate kinase family enzyme
MLSNFERWRLFTDGLVSPDIYIDFSFYYIISAALQRRVWIGPTHSPLYPNLYIILVGEPGIGKGIVIKQVSNILQFHKLKNPREQYSTQNNGESEEQVITKAIQEADFDSAMKNLQGESKSRNKEMEKPLLFPMAPEATTYEALVESMSNNVRRINYKIFNEELKKDVILPYAHSSMCFCLEELASLMRKRTEDLVNFLIQSYDCGDYKYITKTKSKDRIKRCCLCFFAGTTPGFMQGTFDDRLLTEGFASRCFFLCANKNRKSSVWMSDLNHEQQLAQYTLLQHIEKLSTLYGRVEIEPSTMSWIEEWWTWAESKRSNTNPKLNPYYARKPVHVQKLAMALHFGETLEMKIPLRTFQKAIDILDEAEKSMHLALGFEANNPLAKPMQKILRFIQQLGPKTRRDLIKEFFSSMPKGVTDIDEILDYLIEYDKLESFDLDNPKLGKVETYYRVKEQHET